MLRAFPVYLVGQFVSGLGTAVSLVLVPLLVFELTRSALSLGVSMAVQFLPYTLFGLALGGYVDRLSRRWLLITADVLRAVVTFSIPALTSSGHLTVWSVYAASFLSSTLTILFNTAEFAVVPSLVGRDQLTAANGRLSAVSSTAAVAGPFLAGFLVALVSLTTGLVVDALSYLFSGLCLLLIYRKLPGREFRQGQSTTLRHDLTQGLRFVFGHPVLRTVTILLALTNFFVGSTVDRQIVFLAKEHFQASNSEVAWLLAAGGVGVLVASLSATVVRRYLTSAQAILGPMFGGSLCIVLTGLLQWFPATVMVWAVGSAMGTTFIITMRTLRQQLAPPHMLGRVVSVAHTFAWSAIPIGAILGGWLISQVEITIVFVILGLVQLTIASGFLLTPLRYADRFLPTRDDKLEPQPTTQS
jgi:MFS family permease